tara:strand:+ start:2045 stop:2926 length:882 start_codon:yes stop_codon:yes gene_type:complete
MKIFIKNNSFPYKLEKKIKEILVKPGIYTKLTDEEIDEIKKLINKNNKLIASNAIIRSIRSAYINERELTNVINYKKKKNKIIKEYYKNNNVFIISKKYDVSPIRIIKLLLKKHHVSNNNINKILLLVSKKKYDMIKKKYPFNINFLKNIKKVIDNDIFNTTKQDIIKEYATKFEKKIEYSIDNIYKLKYKTEDQLKEEQKIKYGRAILTPDIYLISELYINNIKINWIDAKNYYGANTKIIVRNLKKQIDKYYKILGSGAIVFSLGYSSELNNIFNNNKIILLSFNDFNSIN